MTSFRPTPLRVQNSSSTAGESRRQCPSRPLSQPLPLSCCSIVAVSGFVVPLVVCTQTTPISAFSFAQIDQARPRRKANKASRHDKVITLRSGRYAQGFARGARRSSGRPPPRDQARRS